MKSYSKIKEVYYSNAEDCFDLYKKLQKRIGSQIEFYGAPFIEVPTGNYISVLNNSNLEEIHRLPFSYKYNKNYFLRIKIASNPLGTEMGEKLAALSTFYEALKDEFGIPTFFCTLKGDDSITLQWSFINAQDDIMALQEGYYFDDCKTDQLVFFNHKVIKNQELQELKQSIGEVIGLPAEMAPLVEENCETFFNYKTSNKEQYEGKHLTRNKSSK